MARDRDAGYMKRGRDGRQSVGQTIDHEGGHGTLPMVNILSTAIARIKAMIKIQSKLQSSLRDVSFGDLFQPRISFLLPFLLR